MVGLLREDVGVADRLAAWCAQHLGAAPVRKIFRQRHLSEVIGLVLDDGRSVVVKIRPPSSRLRATTAVQQHLHANGFPCAAVLVEPTAFGSRTATAEAYVKPIDPPPEHAPASPTARLLVRLIDSAPRPESFATLDPAPPWAAWDHDGAGLWPWPDDLDVDLNDHDGPDWVDRTAGRVRTRLADLTGSSVIGHIDWEAHNLDWDGDHPVLVHDWDSIAIRPEVTIAGVAAATFPTNARSTVAATVEETAAFLDAFSEDRSWTTRDHELAWCSGLWVLAYNAKKESLGGGAGYLEHLAAELDERTARARI